MIRRRVKNLKKGDVLYTKIQYYPEYIICGKIIAIEVNENFDGSYYAYIRYRVYKGIDTFSTTRFDSWRKIRETNFEKTATILEEGELDLLMLKL